MRRFITWAGSVGGLTALLVMGWQLEIRWNQTEACAENNCGIQMQSARLQVEIQEDVATNLRLRMINLETAYGNYDQMPSHIKAEFKQIEDDRGAALLKMEVASKERCK